MRAAASEDLREGGGWCGLTAGETGRTGQGVARRKGQQQVLHPANRLRRVSSSPDQSGPRLFDAFHLLGKAACSMLRRPEGESVSAHKRALVRICVWNVSVQKRRRLSACVVCPRQRGLGGGCPMSVGRASVWKRALPKLQSIALMHDVIAHAGEGGRGVHSRRGGVIVRAAAGTGRYANLREGLGGER